MITPGLYETILCMEKPLLSPDIVTRDEKGTGVI